MKTTNCTNETNVTKSILRLKPRMNTNCLAIRNNSDAGIHNSLIIRDIRLIRS